MYVGLNKNNIEMIKIKIEEIHLILLYTEHRGQSGRDPRAGRQT